MLLRHFHKIFILLITASLLACNEHDISLVDSFNPIHLVDAKVCGAEESRAANRTLDENDTIGVFLKSDENYTAINNLKFSYKPGASYWESDDGQLIMGDNEGTLVAYYPYNLWQTGSTVSLITDVYRSWHELYYQPFKAKSTTSKVSLNLKRAYSLIRFSFIKGVANSPSIGDKAYVGDGHVTTFQFTANLIMTAQLDLFTGKQWNEERETKTITCAEPDVPFTLGSTSSPTQKDFLIIPINLYTGNLTFSATVDGKIMNGSVTPASLSPSGSLVAGTMYEITVIVRPTAFVISSVVTTDWPLSTNINVDSEFD